MDGWSDMESGYGWAKAGCFDVYNKQSARTNVNEKAHERELQEFMVSRDKKAATDKASWFKKRKRKRKSKKDERTSRAKYKSLKLKPKGKSAEFRMLKKADTSSTSGFSKETKKKGKTETIELLSDSDDEHESSYIPSCDRASFSAHLTFWGTLKSGKATIQYFPEYLKIQFKMRSSISIFYKDVQEYCVNKTSAPFWVAIRWSGSEHGEHYDPSSHKTLKRYILLFFEGNDYKATIYNKIERKINISYLREHKIVPKSVEIKEFSKYGVTKQRISIARRSPEHSDFLVKYGPDANDTIVITSDDIQRLEPGEFLNDTLIDFYMKFIYHDIFSALERTRVHFFNSFFFTKYRDSKPGVRYQSVKKWTKYDIFRKKFIVIPINDSLHWSLVVVCYLGSLLGYGSENHKLKAPTPCMLYFDSMLTKGASKRFCPLLRAYLHSEIKRKKDRNISITEEILPVYEMRVPQQDNCSDCGLFLLQYAECFAKNPLVHDATPEQCAKWFDSRAVSSKRIKMKQILYKLQQ
eukprot:jgi/Bigna1/87370/estExt_fgenesh1_pg.C_190190